MKKITLLITLMIASLGFSQNLITNGDFESGTTGWSGNALNVVTESENSYSSANVAEAGAAYAVNISYILPITQGTSYKLTFNAWSDTNRTLIAGIGLSQDPWTSATETVNLTTTSQTIVLNFTANFASETSRIIFDMGAATGFVGIDDVILEVVVPTPSNDQVIIQDFEGGGVTGPFGSSSAALASNPSGPGQVAMLSSNPDGEIWQGVDISLTQNVRLTTDKTMSMDVYSLTPLTIAPKVIGGLSGAPSSTTRVSHTGSGWETLTFTFNLGLDNTTIANGDYSAFVIYYNWNTDNNTFGTKDSRVFYVDNIKGVGVESPVIVSLAPTTAAPTPPNRNPSDVISLYSGAYANVASNFDAAWCGASSVQEVTIVDNPTMAFKNNNCQGIVLNSGIDASSFTNLHVDVYIEAGTVLTSSVFNLKFVQIPGGAAFEINFNVASTPALVAGSWLQIDVPVNLTTFNGFKEFGITSNLNNKLWYDNLYAYKGTALGTAKFEKSNLKVYPNPATSNLTIESNSSIERVSVHNILGQEVLSRSPKTNNTTLDISNLQKGTYIVKTTSEGASETTKVIKK